MPSKVFGGDIPENKGPIELEVDDEYSRRLEFNRERDDRRRYAKAVAEGEIVEDEEEAEESEDVSDPEEEIGVDEVSTWIKSLNKLKEHDPGFIATGQIDDAEKKDRKKKKKDDKKKKTKVMHLKDVQAQHLLEDGPDADEEDEGRSSRVQSYGEQQEELRRAVSDALEAGGEESDDDDDEDLLRVKEGDDDSEEEEEDEELKEMADEYFGKESELGEGDKFLRDYLLKQMWKDKDGKGKTLVIDEAELKQISDDEELVIEQEEFETKYRHEETNAAGGIVMGQSRIVEDSVRKKDNPRKKQRENKVDRKKIAEIERQEELKRLKNVKKKEIEEKMNKVLSIAGFKQGEEFPLDARGLEDEFDPVEYDKMMKAAFDDNYYGAEDSELHSDEDDNDDEKPDFDKEDELLGLPKNWDVIQSGDGFTATREKVLKQKDDDEEPEEEEEEEEEEVDEEEEREGKRKRKRKASLVKRAQEALMEEYYKLDYEDTIGDLKTRFKFAKVQPNSYGLEKEEILFLDDTELNQYVPLKKMAPYMEKDWEVNKYKLKVQKHKFSELLERIDDPDEKRSKKKSKKRDREEKRDVVVKEKKPAAPIADEEGEAETSKLSRKAKRRRREAEKKLPPNRMVAYGKTN
ncbi:hypothetical protein HID58_025368 [Brassica napus]|uniref:Kri1-like C-terminal domain-containing protein n=1 Tax=Brassica napus TaxID=3708 RepID=A0ABQ8CM97_BRANA|nr:protein KRI1 homolog [Brassica napus]KAH0917708.1 hypothetical protein HID58_025368 [Brassica napus]